MQMISHRLVRKLRLAAMVIPSLSLYCLLNWLPLVVIGRLLSTGRAEDATTRIAYACANDSTGTCILFDITCEGDEHIQILGANYGYEDKPNMDDSDCRADAIWNCKNPETPECCAARRSDSTMPYSETQLYEIFEQCSWKNKCKARAALDRNFTNIYSSVTYQCAPDTGVKFCEKSIKFGNKISLTYSKNTGRDESECWCVVKSAATILGTAQDFRFLNKADSQCINSMTLTGFRPNESISCSESRQIRHIAMANISGYAEFELNLPANVDVQMVWIVAEGSDNALISAQCFEKNKTPPPKWPNLWRNKCVIACAKRNGHYWYVATTGRQPVYFEDPGQTTDTDIKFAYACHNNLLPQQCKEADIACDKNEWVQITSAFCGLEKNQILDDTCSSTDVIWICSDNSDCCAAKKNDSTSSYEDIQLYNLFNECSLKAKCKLQPAPDNKLGNIYSSVTYKCTPDTRIKFCEESVAIENKISLTYNKKTNGDGNMCWCVVKSTSSFQITAQDIRFLDEGGNCVQSMNLTGFRPNETISCSESSQAMQMVMANSSGYSELLLSVPPNTDNGHLVWIIAEGFDGKFLSAECFSNNQQPQQPPQTSTFPTVSSPEVTEHTTSESKISWTVTTSPNMNSSTSIQTTTSPSSTSAQTTTSSNIPANMTENTIDDASISTKAVYTKHPHGQTSTPYALELQEDNTGNVPVAAIACPIVLVLIGAIICYVIWRKRRSRGATSEMIRKVHKTILKQKAPTKENDNKYDDLAQKKQHIGNGDNYEMLQEKNTYNYIYHSDVQNNDTVETVASNTAENTYTYIDHCDIQDEDVIHRGTGNKETMSTKTVQSNSNNYFILEPQNSSFSEAMTKDGSYETGSNGASEAKQSVAATKSHNYFIMEPQDVSTTEPLRHRETTNISDVDTHNYFVLEPQSPFEANFESNTANGVNDIKKPETETSSSQNYFVLEPRDTYSSIDPNDVVVQTLPDDEYNVLNTKSKGVILDPKYDAIKAKKHEKGMNESDDYSHLEKAPLGNQSQSNYSRVNLKKAQAENDYACEDKYSHLGSTLVKPSLLQMEENDYSHLKANSM